MATEAYEDVCPQCGQEDCDCSPEIQGEALRRKAAGEPALVIASDATQVGKRAKAVERETRKTGDDLNWLMRHEQGRRFMWRLLSEAGIFRNAAVDAGFSTNGAFFKAGQQNVGLKFLSELMADEAPAYGLMVKENSGRNQ